MKEQWDPLYLIVRGVLVGASLQVVCKKKNFNKKTCSLELSVGQPEVAFGVEVFISYDSAWIDLYLELAVTAGMHCKELVGSHTPGLKLHFKQWSCTYCCC